MIKAIVHFYLSDDGITTVEYAVAGGLITIAIIAAINLLSASITNVVISVAALLP